MELLTLQWKQFHVPTDKLAAALKNILTSNYDGMICREQDFDVVFRYTISTEDFEALNDFWDTVTELQFSPTLREIVAKRINDASVFGRSLILDVAVENVEMGITQSGKTRAVADYVADVQRYLESGSLYAALSSIDEKINAGPPAELTPFITIERLTATRAKIQDWLDANS